MLSLWGSELFFFTFFFPGCGSVYFLRTSLNRSLVFARASLSPVETPHRVGSLLIYVVTSCNQYFLSVYIFKRISRQPLTCWHPRLSLCVEGFKEGCSVSESGNTAGYRYTQLISASLPLHRPLDEVRSVRGEEEVKRSV